MLFFRLPKCQIKIDQIGLETIGEGVVVMSMRGLVAELEEAARETHITEIEEEGMMEDLKITTPQTILEIEIAEDRYHMILIEVMTLIHQTCNL